MSKTFLQRRNTWSGFAWFASALCAFAGAAMVGTYWSLALLLLGDALCMIALSRMTQLRRAPSLPADIDSASAYALLLLAYTAVVAVLIGYPLEHLQSEATLGAALAVSGAAVLAMFGLWHLWPAFGLVAIDAARAFPRTQTRGLLMRSIRAARRLSSEHELFFSHGLIVALALLILAQGALSLAGIDAPFDGDLRVYALAAYALVVAPFASWLALQRAAAALLQDCRRERTERALELLQETTGQLAEEPPPAKLPDDHSDLNAMLLRCVRAGQVRLALSALEHGADPNDVPPADDRDQRSLLVLAVLNPDTRLLRGLITHGADLNRAHAGLAPLIAATRDSQEGRAEAVTTLLTNGAHPNCTDADGNTPLHFAALSARAIVAAMLCDAGAALDAINRAGHTPLGVACAAANGELVRFLLDRGAKAEVAHAQPALLAAASIAEDDVQGVKLLLKRKARVDARDSLGRTALMTAALHGHAAIAKALLDAGAQVNASDTRGTTALMEAARADAQEVIDELSTHKPAADLVDHAGRSALMIASQSTRASEDTVRRLLALGAARSLAVADGRRAVDFAAASGRWNIVSLLDPEYPRPATVIESSATMPYAGESPEHLLDALRFANWNVIDQFSACVRDWPQAQRARLFVDLATHSDPATRRWLLNHGLDANSSLEDGTSLLHGVLKQLPEALAAAIELVDAGAQVAGSHVLASVCNAMDAPDASPAALERFALDLIQRGADCFAADADGCTPLAYAVATGSVALAQALLAGGVDPQTRDRLGRTPLFAVLGVSADASRVLIQGLLRAGANPEARCANGETPLGLALARPDAELQHWLNWPKWKLPRRALLASDLVDAAASGDALAVDKLIELGLPIEVTDAQGATPLLRAAGNGHPSVVTCLLERGADPARTAASGATALSAAVSARQDSTVEVLLQHGVSADQRLSGGGTVLMVAAGLGYPQFVGQLLAHGAQVDTADEHGTRALHAAAQYAFASHEVERARRTLEALLEAGASVNACNAAGQTALTLLLGACAEPRSSANQQQLVALLPLLLKRGADVDAQDKRGVGALHACAMHGLLLPARALLAAGADPQRRDTLERTPREIAHLLGYIDVAAELGSPVAPTSAVRRASVYEPK
jgi:ankyrin repeat protein